MRCPSCNGDSIVRKTEQRGGTVQRFRTCKSCFTNYITAEKLVSQTGTSKAVKVNLETAGSKLR